ncbi:protein phosphatase 1 regulatory subunit 36-like [Babylonia areolata]|uniref:protein phosphatase 1 regulatory subunit 36-like n=1 Tax=Babylonia areolata TaxID=304850 RepID=UPI003FD574D9
MSKVAGSSDMIPSSGRWVWKEETCGLEFVSNNPTAERKRGKRQDAKGRDRAVSSRAVGKGRGAHPRMGNIRGHPSKKDQAEHTTVLLDDIKTVAYDMMSEVELLPESFDGLMKADQFDYFLLHLLSYFNCFFEKMNQENKKNPMYIEPSLSEKKAYANAVERMEVAQKLLGRSYCVLVLGLGLEKQHHMECGTSRVSSTYNDRSIFETFYNFCTFVVWITFRRKEFDVIKKEIGRMLRSNTFNPAVRVKYAPEEVKEAEPKDKKPEEKKEAQPVQKISPAEYRRLHPKRPPIKSIINQRSPAIVSILPSPKEEANWLFKKGGAMSASSFEPEEEDSENLVEERFRDLLIDVKTFKTGILGEPYNMFNPMTLSPLGAENEDEEHEGEDGEKAAAEEGQVEKSQASDRGGGASRQPTAVSHTTTDVNTDDEG